MKKLLSILAIIAGTTLFAQMHPLRSLDGKQPKIGVQNAILAKVNDTTISVLDVKKKLDLLFHQTYPQMIESTPARYQFYDKSWRHVLMEMIDNELILADAEEKEMKVTDGEVREEMESRFGPNVMRTLDKVGISYDEAWNLLRKEMLTQRMAWYFIHSKAIQNVNPQDIRQAYRLYIKENPPYRELNYRVISIRSDTASNTETLAHQVYDLLSQQRQSPESMGPQLKEFEDSHASCTVQISTEYSVKDLELSDQHREALLSLNMGEYGKPILQTSRADKKTVAKIFYLGRMLDRPALKFEDLAPKLKEDLTQKAVAVQSNQYLEKLRRYYGYDTAHLKESIPENLNPFSLE